jgi:hypothetical protein
VFSYFCRRLLNCSRAVYADRNIILQPPFRHKLQGAGAGGGGDKRKRKYVLYNAVKVKVQEKFTLQQATKAQRGSRCIVVLFL